MLILSLEDDPPFEKAGQPKGQDIEKGEQSGSSPACVASDSAEKSLSIGSNSDIYGVGDVSQIDMYKLSKLKTYTIYLSLFCVSAGIIPLISVWILSLRLFMSYTKIDNDVSSLLLKKDCET